MNNFFLNFKIIFVVALSTYVLTSCDRSANLNPTITRFDPQIDLAKMKGDENLPTEAIEFIKNEQMNSRKIAGIDPKEEPYLPDKNPKFPLPYFLIPDEMAQFIKTETQDTNILDQLTLKISGKRHYKFFVHPSEEMDFEFLRSAYSYVGIDRTEFMASPISGKNLLVIWNKNNELRKPFIASINLINKTGNKDLDVQVIKEIPVAKK